MNSPVLPGMVNAHSHAFQRAFVGLTEHRSSSSTDDFWSWRSQMYALAMRVSPAEVQRIATDLYRELLRGGYTQVCEFHYLHHAPSGQPYAESEGGPLAFCAALITAAQTAGIGLTLLPVLYERAGFTHATLRPDQARFATSVATVLALRDGARALAAGSHSPFNAGVAVHSLRAAHPASIADLARRVADDPGPLHIHIAEQMTEITDCIAHSDQRPIEWLCAGLGQGIAIDHRWHLVHATHATQPEIEAVAQSGAGLVLCPSTEANLGDGLTDLPAWLAAGVPLAIGSDSHVTRDWREELRLAEYGQRLLHRQRNVLATPQASTAKRLFDTSLAAGARAAGLGQWGLAVGARADLLVLDGNDPALQRVPPAMTLDALVFSSPVRAFARVMVGGEWVVDKRPPPSLG